MTRWFSLSVALTVLAVGVSLYVYFIHYDQLPEKVPTHWGIDGQPDGWTPKEKTAGTFMLVPAMMAGMVVLTVVLPWLSPRSFDLNRFRGTYEYIMFLVVALMGYLHLAILLGSLQVLPLDMGQLILGGICLFFALMGNVLGKVKRNFYVGVRTPWTLASEVVWTQTHRVAAWLFTAAGVVGFLAVLAAAVLGVHSPWLFIVLFVGVMAAALLPVFYSLYLYKKLEGEGRLESQQPAAVPPAQGPA
jgi:uncharacterized membrane protein